MEVVLGVLKTLQQQLKQKRAEFVLPGQINLIFMLICNRMNVL